MSYPRIVDTYLKVENMARAVRFYEAFLGVTAQVRYRDRWTSITDRLGLYRPAYDLEHQVPMTEYDRDTQRGNNVVIVFSADDVDREHGRVAPWGRPGSPASSSSTWWLPIGSSSFATRRATSSKWVAWTRGGAERGPALAQWAACGIPPAWLTQPRDDSPELAGRAASPAADRLLGTERQAGNTAWAKGRDRPA